MITTFLVASFLTPLPIPYGLPAQERVLTADGEVVERAKVQLHPPAEQLMAVFDVGDLTGANDLEDLRSAILRDDLPQAVRVASLDSYLERLETGTVENTTDGLIQSIRTFIEPLADGEFRVERAGMGEIAVVGNKAQEMWVIQFLDAMRSFDGVIDIQVRMYSVPESELPGLVDGRSGLTLDKAALDALTKKLDATKDVEMVTAPRVAVLPGARAKIQTVREHAYIKDFELTILPNLDKEIADPVVDVLQTGVTLDVRAVPIGAKGLAIKAEFQHSTAETPFPTRDIRIGVSGHKVTVQLPEVHIAKASARFDLMEDVAVALSTVDPEGDKGERRGMVILLQAERVEAGDEGEPASGKRSDR